MQSRSLQQRASHRSSSLRLLAGPPDLTSDPGQGDAGSTTCGVQRVMNKDDATMEQHTYLRTHDLAAEHLLIDLGEAATELRGMTPGGQNRRGVTLVKQGGINVVLTQAQAGNSLAEHAAPGAATVQVLDGHVRVRVGDETFEASAGRLIAFDAKVRHHVEAIEDSTLLLTLADPQS